MTRRPRRKFRLRAIRAATDENAGASEASATLSFKTKIAISPGPSQVTTTWMAVVESYSGLHLTKFEQDRFIALAGVAREFSIALKDELAADPAVVNIDEANDGPGPGHRYICGLWLDSLNHGLQWERIGPGPTARVGGIPTWSWASIATGSTRDKTLGGLSVQWTVAPEASDRDAQVFYLHRITSIPVNEISWVCDFSRTVVPTDDFVHANRFNVLTMVARVCQLTVHAPFSSPEDSTAAATLTGHNVDVGRTHWRRVTLPGQPAVIAGWASLEHPDFATVDKVVEATAVFLERRQVKGSLGWGSLRGWHWAFRMLFVRKVEVDGWEGFHERVGVGRLFGPEANDSFEGSQDMILHLG